MFMNTDDQVKFIDAITRLFSVLVWPAIVIVVLVRYGSAFGEFLADLGEFTLKAAGFEASAKRKQVEAAAALAAATAYHPEPGATPEATAKQARAAMDVVQEAATPRTMRQAGKSTVLWVDDRPSNNVHEREAMEAVGISFVLATSTDEALEQAHRQSFDVIISDMGRPPDPQAGYTLLDKLRASGNQTPYIIYAESRSSKQRQAEAKGHGALGAPKRPDQLFEMVMSAVGPRA